MMRPTSPGGRSLVLCAAALATSVPGGGSAGAASATTVRNDFAPPSGPMLLTRTLRRPLPDGKEVIARRTYEVRIVPEASGFRIDGRLTDVTVEAPPVLSALADIERNRPDEGMFPLRLDAAGRLLPNERLASNDSVEKALGVVNTEIAHMRLVAVDMLEAQKFAAQFRARQQRNQWPADLFRPSSNARTQDQAVPLGDGGNGRISIATRSHADPVSGLLTSYHRTVTTDLGGDVRRTEEEWTLVPAP